MGGVAVPEDKSHRDERRIPTVVLQVSWGGQFFFIYPGSKETLG